MAELVYIPMQLSDALPLAEELVLRFDLASLAGAGVGNNVTLTFLRQESCQAVDSKGNKIAVPCTPGTGGGQQPAPGDDRPEVVVPQIPESEKDPDNDGIKNSSDNCNQAFNPGQENFDGDVDGDACDSNVDGDPFQSGSDINDHSIGLGEAGLETARSQGIDVDSGSPEAQLNSRISQEVNPDDWQQAKQDALRLFGVEAMTPTTTTTSTSTAASTTTASSTTARSEHTLPDTSYDSVTTQSESTRSTTGASAAEEPASSEPTTSDQAVAIVVNKDSERPFGGEATIVGLVFLVTVTAVTVRQGKKYYRRHRGQPRPAAPAI